MKSFLSRLAQISVVQTALALFGQRFVSYLLPLVTIPYLARVLGPESWGLVLFAQAIGLYVALVIDYSFSISATREVARQRDDVRELARILSGVLGTKLILAMLSFAIIAVLQLLVPTLREAGVFVWLGIFWAFGFAFLPMFFFQGVERVPRILAFEIPLRVASTVAVFVFVRVPEDAWKVLILQGIAGFLIMIAGMLMVYRDIPFVRPNLSLSLQSLREGRQLFAGKISSSLYWMSNPVILGFVAPVQFVGFYAGAERIVKAVQLVTEPITQALFPRSSSLAQYNRIRLARIVSFTTVAMTAWGVIAGALLYLVAPALIGVLLGPGYEPAVPVIRVLALLLPVMGISMPLVVQWMIPLGLDRDLMWIALAAGILHIPMAVLLALQFAHIGIAWAYVVTETCSLLAIVLTLYFRGLIPFTFQLPAEPELQFREDY